jgi:hypothetical protein
MKGAREPRAARPNFAGCPASLALALWLLVCPTAHATPSEIEPMEGKIRGEASLDFRGYHDRDTTVFELYEARGALFLPLGRHVEIYTDSGERDNHGVIDELFAAYEAGATRLRLGRFFLPIGIHSRSELYYTGFVELPLLKYYPLNGFVAFRSEQGLTVEGGPSWLRYEVAILGGTGSQVALGLDRPEDLSVRLQGYAGRLILGLNGYAGTTQTFGMAGAPGPRRASRLAGLDWRYSAPQWIARGEWWVGSVGDRHPSGGYLDLIYHPTALPPWTFVGRLEQIRQGKTLRRQTIGTRYVPARGWTLQLNLIAETPDIGGRGLHFQIVRFIEF